MKIFLKQRNLYYMKYWCRKVYDADVSVICCNEYINRDDVTMIEIDHYFKELKESQRLLDEYEMFCNELSDIETKVLMAYVYDKEIDMDKKSFESIKLNVFQKWCTKFMPGNCIYIHELDTIKLGKALREARLNKTYSASSVCEYLGIKASALRNYESGRRTPRINILYALCELYGIKIEKIIKESIEIE